MSYIIEDKIIKTEDIDFDFASLGGLGNVVFNCLKKFGTKIAHIDPVTDRKDTYEFILRRSIRTALVMKRKGIKKGDIIMGCSDNHLDACIPIVAAIFLGAIPCSIDPSLPVTEMILVVNQVKPKVIFCIPASLQHIEEICEKLKLNTELVIFGKSQKHLELQSFLEHQPDEDAFKPVVSDDPYQTVIIYCSSGTTGFIKPCCLSHAYFINQTSLIPNNVPDDQLDIERRNFEWSIFKLGGASLCYSPLYWISGGRSFFGNVFFGGTNVLCKNFDPKEFWYLIEKYKIVFTVVGPYHISELVKYKCPPNVNAGSLIKILTTGSNIQIPHFKLFQEMLPNADIVQCYASTETGSITFFESYNKVHRQFHKMHPESLGFPGRGIWYKIVDPETKAVLGPNQEGELYLKSKYFMNGYYNMPRDEAFDSNGWFKTGDIFYYTDDYAFYITDRFRETFKYKHQLVYPCVIEAVLIKHPAVDQAVALGIPHEEDEDRPAAFVVLYEDYGHVTAEEIRKFVDEKVHDREKLRGGVWIVKSLPRTSTGKVLRRELRKMVLNKNNSSSIK